MKLLLFSILFLSGIQFANACKCPLQSVAEAFANTSTIFHGKVINLHSGYRLFRQEGLQFENGKWIETADSMDVKYHLVIAEIAIVQWIKNQQVVDTVFVITNAHESACGYHFEADQEYIIYTDGTDIDRAVYTEKEDTLQHPPDRLFTTSICTRTTPLVKRELEELASLKGNEWLKE